MTDSLTAAASFLSIRRYIEATYGAGSFRRVRDEVAEAYPLFPQVLAPGGTYPTKWLFATLEAAHDLFGPDDFFERCGRAIVDYEVHVLFRFALKFSSPAWVLDKATEAWRQAHSTGSWRMSGQAGHVVARLVGFTTTVNYCRLLAAYFVRLLSLSGDRGLTVEHPACSARGEPDCVFIVRWREG